MAQKFFLSCLNHFGRNNNKVEIANKENELSSEGKMAQNEKNKRQLIVICFWYKIGTYFWK